MTKKKEIKPSYHHGDLRSALIEAATRLVQDTGPEQFSMTDACREAGVSKAAPYRHFSNKEDLLQAVSEEGFVRLFHQLQTSTQDKTPGSNDRISAIGLAYIAFAVQEPAIFKLMFGNSISLVNKDKGPEDEHPAFEVLMGEVVTRTRHRKKEHLMRVARPLWTLVHGASMLTIDNSYQKIDADGDIDEMVRHTTALILAPYPEP